MTNFAWIAAPLNRKLQNDETKKFGALTTEDAAGIKALQNRLLSPPVMAVPYADGYFVLGTDVCNVLVACVRLQKERDTPDQTD